MKLISKKLTMAVALCLAGVTAIAAPSVYPTQGDQNMADLGVFDVVSLMWENVPADSSVEVVDASGVKITVPEDVPAMHCNLVPVNNMVEYGFVTLRIEFNPESKYNGTYVLTIPAGTYKYNGELNEAMTLTYNITGGVDPQPGGGTAVGEIALKSIVPSTDEPLAVIPEDSDIVVTLMDPTGIGYIEGRLDCLDDPIDDRCVFSMKEFIKQDNGTYVWTNRAIDYKLYGGKTYQLTLDCYDIYSPNPSMRTLLGTLHVDYQGATAVPYTTNDIAILAIDPAPGSLLREAENPVTIKFSAPVEFTGGYTTEGGFGSVPQNFTAEALNDEKTEWKLMTKNIAVETTVRAKFVDADGAYVVAANSKVNGVEAMWEDDMPVLLSWAYTYLGNAVDLTVTPTPGSTVTSLYKLKFVNPHAESANKIGWAYNVSPNAIEVYNEAEERVTMGNKQETGEGNSYVEITLAEEVTANGTYTVVVPWQAFALGEEYDAQTYCGGRYTYTIGDNETVYDLTPVSVTPESENSVKELKEIRLTFNEQMALNEVANEPVVTDRTIGVFPGKLSVSDDGLSVIFTLDEAITEDGVYMMSIGEGTFGTAEWVASGRLKGHANEALFYTWTVDSNTGVSVVEVGTASRYYDLTGREVVNPERGAILIRKADGVARKIMVK